MRRLFLAAVAALGLSTAAQAQILGPCANPNYYSGLFHNGCLAAIDLNNNNTAIYAAIGSGGGSGGPFLPLSGGTLTGALVGTSATFSGAVTVPTAAAGTNSLIAASTQWVSLYFVTKDNPVFTGALTLPPGTHGTTQAPDDNSTLLATDAFVLGQGSAITPLMDGSATVGASPRYARGDHVHPTDTSRAPIDSPAFTGTPSLPIGTTAVTRAPNTSGTGVATLSFVLGQAATALPLIDGLAAVGSSGLYAREDHVHPTDASRAPLNSPVFTGTPSLPTGTIAVTQAADSNTTAPATTAFVIGQASSATPIIDGTAAPGSSLRYARGDHIHPTDTTRAPVASPSLTGVPLAPTAALNTNTTQIATTAYVLGQGSNLTPLVDGSATAGTSPLYTRGDHVHPTDTSRAPVASPALTGIPTAPTAAPGTNTTQIASTAFAQASSAAAATAAATVSAGDLFGNPTGTAAPGTSIVPAGALSLSPSGMLSAQQTTYYLNHAIPDISGIVGYLTADIQASTSAETTIATTLTGTGNIQIANFITPPGMPGIVVGPIANALRTIWASVDDPTAVAQINVQVLKRALDGTETSLSALASPNFSNTSAAAQIWTAATTGVNALQPTDRLVFRVTGARVSGPASIVLTTYYDGTLPGLAGAHASSVTQPTPIGMRSDVAYTYNVRDAGAKGDLVTGIDGVIGAGASVLSSASVPCLPQDVTNPPKRFEMNGVGATLAGAPFTATITGCSGSNFQLSASTTVASGRGFLNLVGDPDNSAITGSYVIGDMITFVGGDTTGGTATVVQVAAVEAVGAIAVVNGGSGGKDGVVTLTGTTGEGNPIEISGTVVAGALVSATLISNNGYIVAPNNSADPVVDLTGNNPLAGATISYQLGISQASITTRGNYLTVPPNPIASTAGSISGATGAVFNPTAWVNSSTFIIGTDDTPIFTSVINAAISTMTSAGRFSRRVVRIPAGNYLINGSELPVATRPIRFEGDGSGQTQIYSGALYSGAHVFGFSELFSGQSINPSNGFVYQMGQLAWGAGVHGINFYGNLAAASIPDAIVLYGRNTDMGFDDIGCFNIGSCIISGRLTGSQTISYWRESSVRRVRSYNSGRAGKGVIDINSVAELGQGGTANELSFFDMNIFAPRGYCIRLGNQSAGAHPSLNMRFFDTRCEAQGRDPNATGANLIQVGNVGDTGSVDFVDFIRTWLVSPPKGASAIQFTGTTAASTPHDISFTRLGIGGGAPMGGGINIDAGYNLEFDIGRSNTWAPMLTVAPSDSNYRQGKVLGAGSTTTSIILDSAAVVASGSYVGNALVIPTTASVTASFSGATMTVTAVASGMLAVGQTVGAVGIPFGTTIAAFVSGTGGTGTYTVSATGLSLGATAVAASLIESRLITAYNGSTKTATVASLQTSPAGFSTAPTSGAAYSIDQLVQPFLYFNGRGVESAWTQNIGAGSAQSLLSSPFLSGSLAPGAMRSMPVPINLTAGLVQFGATTPTHVAAAQTTPPALTSCGTSPAIVGTDQAGLVTMGTGSPTGCVITFKTPYAAAPFCNVTWMASPLAVQSYTVSASAITLSQTAANSNKVQYSCTSQAGG